MTSIGVPRPKARAYGFLLDAPPPARRQTLLLLVFVLLSLSTLLVGPILLSRRSEAIRAEITEKVEPARAALERIELALAIEVASIRGYLLTGDSVFLASYRQAQGTEGEQQRELAQRAAEIDPGVAARARELLTRAERWRNTGLPLTPESPSEELRESLRRRQGLYTEAIASAAALDSTLAQEAADRRQEIEDLERRRSWFTALLTTLAIFSAVALGITDRRIVRLADRERLALAALAREAARLEARVEERTAELQETNRELEAFAHTVSHDLRAPVRAVGGFAAALREDAGPRLSPEELDYLGRIEGAAGRMDALIRGLLAYSQLSRREIQGEPLSLESVVQDALRPVEQLFRKDDAELIIQRPLLPVNAHRLTLVQAVQNLLTNAAKFVPPGRRPRVVVRSEPRDGMVRLWVEDNGIGIDAGHQQRVFRVFERLHGSESYPGTGVGLAIVRRGVERMGGRTGVESAPGAGSRFWIDLPAPTEQS